MLNPIMALFQFFRRIQSPLTDFIESPVIHVAIYAEHVALDRFLAADWAFSH